MDYGDLTQLFTMAGPATAGWNAGVKEFQDEQANDLAAILKAQEIRKGDQTFAHEELMNPLRVTNQGLINSGLEADLPGKRADSRRKVVDADLAEATKQTKLDQDRVARLQTRLQEGETAFKLALQAAQYMGKGPDAEARKRQFLASGAIPQGEVYDAILNTPATELFGELSSMQEQMAQLKDDYIKMIGQTRATGEETRKTNKELADQGRFRRADRFSLSIEQRLSNAKTPTEKAEILENAYYLALDAGNAEAAEGFRQRALDARQRVAEDARNRGVAPKEGGLDTARATGMEKRSEITTNAPIAGGNTKPAGPKVGTIVDGYIFMGGNPASPDSWKKQ